MSGSALSRRLRADPPHEIVVVMLSAVGDAVHVLPVVNALRRHWPRSRITWIVQPLARTLARHHPAVDELLVFRRRRGLTAWRSFAELASSFRGRSFDLALGLQVYLKAGIITALLPATTKLGFDRRRARDLQWIFTDERVPARENQHVQDQYFEFLEHLGVDPEPIRWDIVFSEEEQAARARFFEGLDAPALAVVVGTSKKEKNWRPVAYARVLEEVERRHGLRPVLVGGPSALERRLADRILKETGARAVDTLGDDLRRLMWIVDGATLTLSPDTGPLHVSRALETPVVGLYGHTNPRRHGPYRKYTDLIVDGYARRPDEDYPVSMEHRDGMARVTVDRVLEKLDRAMERYVGQS